MGETDAWTLFTIVLMAGVTVLTRCLFFLSDKPWTLPHWAQRGLQYAPIAALGAVVIPEVVMTQGALIQTWQEPPPVCRGCRCGLVFLAQRRAGHHRHWHGCVPGLAVGPGLGAVKPRSRRSPVACAEPIKAAFIQTRYRVPCRLATGHISYPHAHLNSTRS
jgi:branched-subunit amino acid transport protein